MEFRKEPPQLLFTRHQRQGIDHEDYICLWPGRKNSPCEFSAPDFSQLIIHFFKQHGLKLHQGIDYCQMCQKIFLSKISATEHQVRHGIDVGRLYDGPLDEGGGESSTEELAGIYEKLNDLRKEILRHIFRNYDDEGEDMVDSQTF